MHRRALVAMGLVLAPLVGACHRPPPPPPDPQAQAEGAKLEQQMAAFRNRTIHRTLTPGLIASIPDSDLEQTLLDYLDSLAAGADPQRERSIIEAQSPGLRMVYATMLLEGEVNNGGFNQFFWNSSGQYADEALAGYRLIGAKDHAALTEAAIALYAREKQVQDGFKRQGTLQAFSESYKHTKLNQLDDRFYKLTEDSSKLRIAYVRAHPADFVGGADVQPRPPPPSQPLRTK